ncbi:multiple sugar transport system permease protein [Cryobacterium sp. MP_M5]|uniref:carbohydrate ABC transporter permease n=1 Tax=unclassified Cryobacterium TaxID=2649013 RepID=UPI0018C99068|nr:MULTISPECIES: sugar ABC transporter permease [unclassified Cryobacterium]MBG6060134.1 multiple sugar transport system permease protein [Cryobacterium sp. MP_M3]MEC5178573.1 multiple sugar transport system permease protein [Cryobacterium sp. MP_M5]
MSPSQLLVTRPRGRTVRPRASGFGRSALRSTPLVPALILLALFLLAPIVSSFYGSFTDSALTGGAAQGSTFIGLKNYAKLFSNPDFYKSIWLTILFLVGSAIVGQNVLGLGLALLMQTSNRIIRSVVGTLVVSSWVLPEIVAAFAAYAFFHNKGTLNAMLGSVGITGPDWLYALPMIAIILANVWRGTAFSMLVYTAALSDVPQDVNESAEMDGAGGVKRLVYITLPIIRQTISTNLMLTTLQTLSAFTIIYVMTGGGPGTNSSTLPVLAYQEAFKFSQLGLGTAIATILLLIGAVFSVIYIRALKPGVD